MRECYVGWLVRKTGKLLTKKMETNGNAFAGSGDSDTQGKFVQAGRMGFVEECTWRFFGALSTRKYVTAVSV